MSKLCSICARGGSKGVKNKNIREMHGKPLIAYSIEQALKSQLFEHIAVSSDSPAILEAAAKWGADILIERPLEMASDTSAKLPAIRHCVQQAEEKTNKTFSIIVDLDATSPLRTTEDIINSVNLLETRGVSNLITGAPSRRSPYFNLVEMNDEGFVRLSKSPDKPIVRRQDAPKCFDMNASIYIWKREILLNDYPLFLPDTVLYEMPEDRSVDIDSELDWRVVEWIMGSRKEEVTV
ncbi:cytidylyltransferase domain-containing protein [Paenibacillus sp. CF384]|uniref:acylneuraminate cytidylyltransferase family protein n=1 Tax=Paenibacillus sp. CF384 TaxID=1884382 RepID=UPI000896E449|nr:acylneuraminate cytidylyltransferase family protein [Paenibacillus sp. CF384]SDX28780.1 N-acylneuraminate cytidylyltransferase/CMP-N,N'-diacetyllegionaminic acid synthase [Paenibacillus sp. CF384]